MSAVRYPIAANAEAALSAPMGRAARRSDAGAAVGAAVDFITEAVGPAFPTREAALQAYVGRLDDDGASIAPEDRFCELRELSAAPPPKPGKVKPVRPIYRGGRRWPAAPPAPATIWRLSISYWRVLPQAAEPAVSPPSPAPRRAGVIAMDPEALKARLSQPLRPVAPQQPLDIGLFEWRPPEAPHILMPDE